MGTFTPLCHVMPLTTAYSTREMVDTTLVFTINDGALTCLVVIAFIACVRDSSAL